MWGGVTTLPPEDQPDAIDIGPVRGIPIIEPDDPRFDSERRAWSEARSKAQAMHSADELLRGLRDDDWMVRFEVIDRLIARAADDERTVPALVVAADDPVVAVRETVVMRLGRFSDERAVVAIHRALLDEDADVRSAAEYALGQVGG
jgi:HEAT repeat protein